MAAEELLTYEEVAEVLKVCLKTVKRMRDRGELAVVKFGPRCHRVRRAHLDRLIERNTHR